MIAILITIMITALVIVLLIIVCLPGPEFLNLDHSEHPTKPSQHVVIGGFRIFDPPPSEDRQELPFGLGGGREQGSGSCCFKCKWPSSA